MGALTHTHHEHRPQTRLLFTTFTAALQRALRDMLRLRLPPPRHQQCPVTIRTRLREYVKTALHGWIRSTVLHAALVLGVTFARRRPARDHLDHLGLKGGRAAAWA